MTIDATILRQAFEMIERYVGARPASETPVVRYVPADGLRDGLDLTLGEHGVPAEDLVPLLQAYLEGSVRTAHPQFLNQLYGGFSLTAWLGDAVGALANTSMYTYEVAPVATMMELELIDRMNALLGYGGGEGILCTGGSNANTLALLCARDRAFPEVKRRGFGGEQRPILFVSDQAHYSFVKAAFQLGIGTDGVVRVRSGPDGAMLPDELEREIVRCREEGAAPFFVAATCGTTVMGSFDPLLEIHDVTRRHGLWLHADGSWGGPVALSRKHRGLLDGVERTDSFTWDAHKLMGVPLICTAFLTPHAGALARSCGIESAGDTEYLFHDDDDAAYNLGRKSLQCGRRVDSLKLWLAWKHLGDRGYEARVDRLFDLAGLAVERIASHPRLELVAPVQSLNVCFRYVPTGRADVDEFNLAVRERMRKTGGSFVNYSTVGDRIALRLVFANPALGAADLDRFFGCVDEAAKALDAS